MRRIVSSKTESNPAVTLMCFVSVMCFSRYGDMRQVMGFEIVHMWQSLGKFYDFLTKCLETLYRNLFLFLFSYRKQAHFKDISCLVWSALSWR